MLAFGEIDEIVGDPGVAEVEAYEGLGNSDDYVDLVAIRIGHDSPRQRDPIFAPGEDRVQPVGRA